MCLSVWCQCGRKTLTSDDDYFASLLLPLTFPTNNNHGQDALSKLQEEMLGRGASRAGQIFPHPVFQVPRLPEFFGTGRLLLQRRRLLLHAGLSGPFRHQVFSLRTLRRRGSGHRSGEDVPQQLLHLRPLQATVPFRGTGDLYRQRSSLSEMCPNSRHDGHAIAANETRPFQSDTELARLEQWSQHVIVDNAMHRLRKRDC